MRLKQTLWAVVALVLVVSIGCVNASDTLQHKQETEDKGHTQTALARTPTVTGTLDPTATETATATATASGNAPRPVASGGLILRWPAGASNLQLQADSQSQLNLFFQMPPSASTGASMYAQSQRNADGSWTEPKPITPDIETASELTAVPDASGRLCVFWSGNILNEAGISIFGLYRNCQKADGSWEPMADLVATTEGRSVFAPARAPDGTLHSLYIAVPGLVEALLYSPVDPQAAAPLAGTQLSGELPVLLGRLAIDSNGGFHAAWVESTGGESFNVQSRHSADGGETWSVAEQLFSGSTDNPGRSSFLLAADLVGNVHLAWLGDESVIYRRWTAAEGWGESETLTAGVLVTDMSMTVAPDGTARVVWAEYAAESRLVMRALSAAGVWSEPETVSPGLGDMLGLATDGTGTSHLVWQADDELRYLELP
jgi:hypothetical protein